MGTAAELPFSLGAAGVKRQPACSLRGCITRPGEWKGQHSTLPVSFIAGESVLLQPVFETFVVAASSPPQLPNRLLYPPEAASGGGWSDFSGERGPCGGRGWGRMRPEARLALPRQRGRRLTCGLGAGCPRAPIPPGAARGRGEARRARRLRAWRPGRPALPCAAWWRRRWCSSKAQARLLPPGPLPTPERRA